MTRFPSMLRAALVAGLVLVAAPAALAGPPNWKAHGTGTTEPVGAYDVDNLSGQSTHLGRFVSEGFHQLDPTDFTFEGQATWTAADGSKLFLRFAGQAFPSGDPDYPYGMIAHIEAVGGTGRLAGAHGCGVMTGGFTGVPGNLYFEITGTLKTRK